MTQLELFDPYTAEERATAERYMGHARRMLASGRSFGRPVTAADLLDVAVHRSRNRQGGEWSVYLELLRAELAEAGGAS